MDTSQRCSPSRSRTASLKEGFLLPARNLGFFITNFLLVIAYTAVSVHAYSVSSAAVSSAVTTCCGERRTSFRALLGKVFTDGLKGPFATAAFCNVLHICACRGAITSLGFCFAFYQKYTSEVLRFVEPLLFFLAQLSALYIDVVGTVRVVVSVADPGGCFHSVRVLRHGRWLAAEKTMQPVLLIVVKGAVMVAMSLLTFMYPIARFYHRVAFDVLLGFIYAILYGSVQLWFVCATTVYQCRLSKNVVGRVKSITSP